MCLQPYGYGYETQGDPPKFPHTHKGDSSKFPGMSSPVNGIEIFPVRRLHGNLNFLGTSKGMLHHIGNLTLIGEFPNVCMYVCMAWIAGAAGWEIEGLGFSSSSSWRVSLRRLASC